MLTSHKALHLIVNKCSDILQAETTTFSYTRFLYYMFHCYHCHSNLVTTPSSCIVLTQQSGRKQNLTCPLTSCWRTPMTLDTLKNELEPPFTANVTKNHLLCVDKNGEHPCEENLHNGSNNGEHSCGEIFYGNNTKKHIKSHHKWKLLHHPCSHDDNQHMGNPHAFSNHVKGNTQPWTQPLRS